MPSANSQPQLEDCAGEEYVNAQNEDVNNE
jgi:hypothetical protein